MSNRIPRGIDDQEGRNPPGICRNIQVSAGQGIKVSMANSLHSGRQTGDQPTWTSTTSLPSAPLMTSSLFLPCSLNT